MGIGDDVAFTAAWLGVGVAGAGVVAADMTGAEGLGIGLGCLTTAGDGFRGVGGVEAACATALGAVSVVPSAVGAGVAGAVTAGAGWLLGGLTAEGTGTGCFSREAK